MINTKQLCILLPCSLKILLVNNQIYGLTKGQYSPTSAFGKVTKSTPTGSIDYPINALCIAIASEATFIARTLDSDPKHMGYVMERAMAHKGVSFIEIYQNCIIFNDKAFAPVTGRDTREDRMVYLEDNKPLVFGKKKDRVVRMNGLKPEVVEYQEDMDHSKLLIHSEKIESPHYAYLLSQMMYPEMPVPFGVFRAMEKPAYDEMLEGQVQSAIQARGEGDLQKLIYGSATWNVE